MGDIVTMDDLTNQDIVDVLDDAERLVPVARGDVYLPLLKGKVLANMFFENSTRTRMSFETAMKRLGGSVLNFTSIGTSVARVRLSMTPCKWLMDMLMWPLSGIRDRVQPNTAQTQWEFLF